MGQIQERKINSNFLIGGFQSTISRRKMVRFTYINLFRNNSKTCLRLLLVNYTWFVFRKFVFNYQLLFLFINLLYII